MVDLEAQVMLLGIYKSFEELEDNLTIEEMNLILKADAAKEERNHKVMAAVQGLPWGDSETTGESGEDAMARIKRKAAASAAGKTEEEIELESLGIKFT